MVLNRCASSSSFEITSAGHTSVGSSSMASYHTMRATSWARSGHANPGTSPPSRRATTRLVDLALKTRKSQPDLNSRLALTIRASTSTVALASLPSLFSFLILVHLSRAMPHLIAILWSSSAALLARTCHTSHTQQRPDAPVPVLPQTRHGTSPLKFSDSHAIHASLVSIALYPSAYEMRQLLHLNISGDPPIWHRRAGYTR